jgi:ATP-dependent helicase/nuclease subunit A
MNGAEASSIGPTGRTRPSGADGAEASSRRPTSTGVADSGGDDSPARDRIRTALDETLFVEAGAGSGKTRALVERVLALVLTGDVSLAAIAAITFTEKAASELRDRIRTELTTRAAQARAEGDDPTLDRCRRALDELDGAAIGTLHSFAQRILAQHPIEAALPPRI